MYFDPRKPGKYVYGEFKFDYEPFYAGKGYGKRAYVHLFDGEKNNKGKVKILKDIKKANLKPIVKILDPDIFEKDALTLETHYIKTIGKLSTGTGPLTNLRDKQSGGESGFKHSKKTKLLLRSKRLGKNNPMFGRKASDETKKLMSESRSGENSPNFGKKMSKKTIKKAVKTRKANDIKFNRKPWTFGKFGKDSPVFGKKYSEETKEKDRQAKLGKKNPNYGKKGRLSKNIKKFKITNPKGKIFYTKDGLSQFCEKYKLTMKNMSAVARGKRKHHKGWKCEYA